MIVEWNTTAPPDEWKPGMLVRVKHFDGSETDELIGSITLVDHYNHTDNTVRQVPGTEHDHEGLGVDKIPWRVPVEWHGSCIIAWAPGVALIHPFPLTRRRPD